MTRSKLILQKPRSLGLGSLSTEIVEKLEDSFACRVRQSSFAIREMAWRKGARCENQEYTGKTPKTGLPFRMQAPLKGYIIDEPAHDEQAGHNANPIAENVDTRHHLHPSSNGDLCRLV